jgi:restriction system protein
MCDPVMPRKMSAAGRLRRADKEIIITTGTFTAEARREASRDGVPPIELIDGEKLIDMLQDLELGLRPVKAYEVDEAFFLQFKN